jgi:putative transposase
MMKKSRLTKHQIISILKKSDIGMKVTDIFRQYGINKGKFCQWQSKFGGMEASDIKKLRGLENELSRYKQMYADLAYETMRSRGHERREALRGPLV